MFLSPVDETCYGLPAGDVRIDLVVSNCEGVGNHNAFSGWNSDRQMIIMEVTAGVKGKLAHCLQIDSETCASLPVNILAILKKEYILCKQKGPKTFQYR